MIKYMEKDYKVGDTMEKNVIQAVHDDDLLKLLTSLGVYENILNGNSRCLFCNHVIDMDNLISVFPWKTEIAFCCDKDECYEKLIKLGNR